MDITVLNRKRGGLKSKITKYENDFDDDSKIWDVIELKTKLDSIKELKCELKELEDCYYSVVDDEKLDEQTQQLSNMFFRIEDLQVRVLKLINSFKEISNSNVSEHVPQNIDRNSIKLPDIPLPSFDGKYEEWFVFKEQFVSLVEKNNIDDSKKLYYLQASLKGVVKQLQTTDDTYSTLMKALQDRYENKRIIVDMHINALLNLEKLSHESAKELRSIIDKLLKHIRALKTLKFNNNNFSEILLINIVLQKLDRETRKQFEFSIDTTEVPTWDAFISFLQKRCQVLESLNRNTPFKPKPQMESNYRPRSLMLNYKNSNKPCIACNSDTYHHLYKCSTFLNMSSSERFELVKKKNICYGCLGRHKLSDCKSKIRCNKCNKSHHTLIHKQQLSEVDPSASNFSYNSSSEVPSESLAQSQTLISSDAERQNCFSIENKQHSLAATTNCYKKKTVLLSTAIVYIADSMGKFIEGRCVLDSASQVNFVSSQFANKLGLRKHKTYTPVCSVNGSSLALKSKIYTTIANASNTFNSTLEFLILPKITDYTPANYLDIENIMLPRELELADPNYFKPGKVDLLIGSEIFFDLLREGKFRLPNEKIIFQNTVFGYIASGSLNGDSCTQFCGLTTQFDSLEENMKRFFEIESVDDNSRILSSEETFCEKYFVDTHYRDAEGRYVVELPLKENVDLGKSRDVAERRLNSLWHRLKDNPKVKSLYVNFMKEYESLGHMKEIEDNSNSDAVCYYMPHHGVYRPEKLTTPLRVVFNASSPTSNGLSLNNILLNGGVVQDELFSIILRFRSHKYVFTADIQKMYRQILVHPKHRDFQRILWKKEFNSPVKVYQLQTITYGTTSASFLATRALKQLALDEGESYPLAAKILLSDFYVDDALSGSNSISVAKEMKRQLIEVLQKAGMNLHKWCSNNQELGEGTILESEHLLDDSSIVCVKALGMLWKPASDTFSFKVSLSPNDHCTKRAVLSHIARFFDPLGLMGPVTTKAKIFLQHLWSLKVNWDDMLPDDVINDWKKIVLALPSIESMELPRHIDCEGKVVLHGFADASSVAYGCVIYLQCISPENEISTKLVCSKSRVAPLKPVSIPRLELCACLLLSRLVKKTLNSLHLNIDEVYLWSDSTIALAWIHKEPCLLKTFVSNRVSRIQDLTNKFKWKHVTSELNPADFISRGLYGDQIVQNCLWWQGPHFLTKITNFDDFHFKFKDSDSTLEEMKPVKNSVFATNVSDWVQTIIDRVSNYSKLIRIFSFLFRFINNCRHPHSKALGSICVKEIREAENFVIKNHQKGEYFQEIKDIKNGHPISPKSKLRFLNPFIGEDGLLRIGGRLKHSTLKFESKFPIVLPAKSRLTLLILRYYHLKNLHIGPTGLLNSVRQKFWPINGRNLTRKIVHECVTCFKAKPIPSGQLLGDLPHERVTRNYAFDCTGIDFCGPFLIRYKNQRKGTYHKMYVCIFVCLVTRAIHLEIVSDLTTESFLATLKRFFARRGKSSKLFTDNAKTFVGAQSELKKLYNIVRKPDERLARYLTSEEIQWNFIPPRSPNFGGLWEAGVKSFKYYLKRVVGDARLTIEEFLTVINQIEGILNSRPITPLSSDPEDLDVLTPSHFLIGRPVNNVPDPDHTLLPDNRLTHWQHITKLTQIIWKRWSNSYLSNLQQRSKWLFSKENVKIGTLVIIKEDGLLICKWLLGRITELFPGADGKVRVVNVKTKNGIFKRCITKICVLPIENENP